MYDGVSRGLLRLSRRLVRPGALRRALRDVSGLMNNPWVAPEIPPAFFTPVVKPVVTPAPAPQARQDGADAITEVTAFGSNPGGLRMLMSVPATVPARGAPLVVVLHGCGQHAAQFATETGWIAMARRLGFVVVMPEQTAANNAGRCFNWFRTDDIARGEGEALSIRQMIATAVAAEHLDERRIYVVGLSAGGAMSAAMLAAYPDLFAAGASVAGLPVGCAFDVSSALARMAHAGTEPAQVLADRARVGGPVKTPAALPRISIWQGDRDQTVVPANADQMAAQFVALHGLTGEGTALPATAGVTGRQWLGAGGVEVELRSIAGMSHGYPIAAGTPVDRFVLPVGIDATEAIARFWGLLPTR